MIEFGKWLEKVIGFSLRSDIRGEMVVPDWLFVSPDLAYSGGENAHVLHVKEAIADGDGWIVDTGSEKVSIQLLWPAQEIAVAEWQTARPIYWRYPLQSVLGIPQEPK